MAGEVVVEPREGDAEHVNGKGAQRRPRSPRKVSRATAETPTTKPKSKPGHKVDKSGKFEFGGDFGTLAMMIIFPILMYYLWICSTFYGGALEWKKGSETWLAFLDRMVGHVAKVHLPVRGQLS